MKTECHCIALRRAARRVTALYDEALAPLGVNIAQFGLLRAVERAEPIALTELGRQADLDRSTVGRNVRVLEKIGLVALSGGADRREAMVSLAEDGRRILDEGAPLWDGAQDAFEARFGQAAAHALREKLIDI